MFAQLGSVAGNSAIFKIASVLNLSTVPGVPLDDSLNLKRIYIYRKVVHHRKRECVFFYLLCLHNRFLSGEKSRDLSTISSLFNERLAAF